VYCEETALNDGPPRGLLIAAIGVAVSAVLAVLVIAWLESRPAPPRALVVPAVPVPQGNSAECAAVMAALPQRLGDYGRAQPAAPVPPATAAWHKGDDDQPILLRCGVGQPADFVVGVELRVISDVQWFPVSEKDTGRSTWFVVDRPVYVALTLPDGTGAAPLQQISGVIAAKLAAVPIRPGPPR
jgi:hypothetical protein